MVGSSLMILTGACHAPVLCRQKELLYVSRVCICIGKGMHKYLVHEKARKRANEMGGYAQDKSGCHSSSNAEENL